MSRKTTALLAGFGVGKWRKCGIFQWNIQNCIHPGTVMQRYTVPTKRRQLLVVSEDVHRMVKIHAREKGLTMAEATCVLLLKLYSRL